MTTAKKDGTIVEEILKVVKRFYATFSAVTCSSTLVGTFEMSVISFGVGDSDAITADTSCLVVGGSWSPGPG